MSCFGRHILFFLLLTQTLEATRLRVYLDWFHNIEFAGIYAAMEKGWYKRAGIDLELVFHGLDIIPSVLRNEAEIGMLSAHDVIKHIASGADLKAFAANYQLNPNCIIVGQDSKIQNLKDLKGKILGVFSPQEYDIYRIMLGSAGLLLSDVKFKSIKTFKEKEIIGIMRRKEVDAIIAWEFNWTVTFALLGYNVRVFPGYEHGFHFYGIVYFAKSDYIKKNKRLLHKFLKVTFDGWREVLRNPDYYANLVVDKWFPKGLYINGSKTLTLRQQRLELKLRRRYFLEGVTLDTLGAMSKLKWAKSLQIAKQFGMIPSTSKISVMDLYDPSVFEFDGGR